MGGIEVLELELTIIRGDGLAAKDSNIFGYKKLSDPYVEVRLCPYGPLQGDDKKYLVGKTIPKMKTLQPRWDATFITSFPLREFTEFAAFELTIMDYDKYGTDDPMGIIHVKIPPSNLGSDLKTKWHRIPASSIDGDEATGRIECTMRTKKKTLKPGEEPTAYQDPIIPLILQGKTKKTYKKYLGRAKRKLQGKKKYQEQEQISAGPKEDMVELDIKIIRARDLAPMDTNLLGFQAKSDPYIVVRLCPQGPSQGGNKLYMGKTPTVLKTLDPIWKDQNSFSITLPMTDFNRFSQFELTIWDYDKSNEDDIMGVVPVPFRLERPGTTTKWYKVPPLSAGSVGATGDVECEVHVKTGGNNLYATGTTEKYIDETMDVEESLLKRMSTTAIKRSSTTTSLGLKKRVEVVDLSIKVKRAQGLTAMDSNVIGMSTSSDPYSIVNLCRMGPSTPDYMKIELGKTPTEFKTLNPKWNKTFKTTMLKSELSEFSMFEITIWDFDETDDDDLMGKVCVHIPALSGTTTKWYSIPPTSAGPGIQAKGEVECVVTVQKRMELEEPDEPADGPGAQVVRPIYRRTNPLGLELDLSSSDIGMSSSTNDMDNTTDAGPEESGTANTVVQNHQKSGDQQDTDHAALGDTNEQKESSDSTDEITLQQLVKKSAEPDDVKNEPVEVTAKVNNTFWSGWGGDYDGDKRKNVDTTAKVEQPANSSKGEEETSKDNSAQRESPDNVKVKPEDTDAADGIEVAATRSDGNKEASSDHGPQPRKQRVGRINRKTIRRSNSMKEGSRQNDDKKSGVRRVKSAKSVKPTGKAVDKDSKKPNDEKPVGRRTKSVGAKPKRKDENSHQQKDDNPDSRRTKSLGATRKRNKESTVNGANGQKSSEGKKTMKKGSSHNNDDGKIPTKKPNSKRESRGKQGSSSSLDSKTNEKEDSTTKKSRTKSKKNPDRESRSRQGSSSSLDMQSDKEKDLPTKQSTKRKKNHGSSSSFSAVDIDIDIDDTEMSRSKSKKNRKAGSSSSFSATDIDIDENEDVEIEDDAPKKAKSKSKKKSGSTIDKSNGMTKSQSDNVDKKSSKEDGSTSTSQASLQKDADPEDVYQQRLKVCTIYEKYRTLKRSQSRDEIKRMTLFADQ